jgi:hypothetical protein
MNHRNLDPQKKNDQVFCTCAAPYRRDHSRTAMDPFARSWTGRPRLRLKHELAKQRPHKPVRRQEGRHSNRRF